MEATNQTEPTTMGGVPIGKPPAELLRQTLLRQIAALAQQASQPGSHTNTASQLAELVAWLGWVSQRQQQSAQQAHPAAAGQPSAPTVPLWGGCSPTPLDPPQGERPADDGTPRQGQRAHAANQKTPHRGAKLAGRKKTQPAQDLKDLLVLKELKDLQTLKSFNDLKIGQDLLQSADGDTSASLLATGAEHHSPAPQKTPNPQQPAAWQSPPSPAGPAQPGTGSAPYAVCVPLRQPGPPSLKLAFKPLGSRRAAGQQAQPRPARAQPPLAEQTKPAEQAKPAARPPAAHTPQWPHRTRRSADPSAKLARFLAGGATSPASGGHPSLQQARSAWQQALGYLSLQHPQANQQRLHGHKVLGWQNYATRLVVSLPSQDQAEWCQQHLGQTLARILDGILARKMELRFVAA